MPRRRGWWVLSGGVLAAVLVALLLLVGRGFRLPIILQKQFLVAGTIKEVGWRHLDFAALGWGPVGQETVEIDTVSMHFSLAELFRKRVAELTVSGLTIHLLKGPDGYTLRGFTPFQTTRLPAAPHAWRLPVGVGRLQALQGQILIHEQESLQAIPFQGNLRMEGESSQRLQFVVGLGPEASAGKVSGEVDLIGRMVRGDVACQLPRSVADGRLQGKYTISLATDGLWHLITSAAVEGRVKGSGEPLLVKTPVAELRSEPLQLECQGQGGGDDGWSATCSLATERIIALGSGLELAGVTMHMPWRFSERPLPPMEGRFAVSAFKSHGKTLGGLAVTLRQKGPSACSFEGDVHSVGRSKYDLLIKGEFGFDRVRHSTDFSLDLHLPGLNLGDIDLAEFVDLPEKIAVGGRLEGQAKAQSRGGHREASAAVLIKDGLFANVARGQEVSGITGRMSVPDLLEKRSDLAQFSFQKAKFGAVSLTDGAFAVRLEGKNGLFVEKASANWGEGVVRASSLRFIPGSPNFEVDLSCERLSLSQVFGQLGGGKLSGNGILNGRIPLSYKDGVLRVVGGLLHSPPSVGGSLRMMVRDLITAGVPADAPQFGQLEFAAAALQDFMYRSMSIALDSKAENLVVAMKIDGHPAKPLPFRYDATMGAFSRVTAAGAVGIDQPVQLDVNFLLPVDTLLNYGNDIKSFLDKMQ